MGDTDHGHTGLCQFLHNFQNFADHFRIQSRGGLIEEHHFRLHGQSTDDGDTLLLTAGQLAGVGIGAVSQTNTLQQVHGLGFRLFLALLQQMDGSQGHVFQNSHVGEQVKVLEHHAHLLTVDVDVHLLVGDVYILKEDLTAGGNLQQIHAPQEGGFAGTGGTHDDHHFTLMDLGGDTVQGLDLTADTGREILLDALGFNDDFLIAHCFSVSFPVCPPDG